MSKYIQIGKFMVNKNSIANAYIYRPILSGSIGTLIIDLCNQDLYVVTDKKVSKPYVSYSPTSLYVKKNKDESNKEFLKLLEEIKVNCPNCDLD